MIIESLVRLGRPLSRDTLKYPLGHADKKIPHLLLSFPYVVLAIYDSGITFFSSVCIYSRSLVATPLHV